MDDYVATLNNAGESILQWADPENKFRGFTEVRDEGKNIFCKDEIIVINLGNKIP